MEFKGKVDDESGIFNGSKLDEILLTFPGLDCGILKGFK